MRTIGYIFASALLIAVSSIGLKDTGFVTGESKYTDSRIAVNKYLDGENEVKEYPGGHEMEKRFFALWNHPYSNGIPPEVQFRIMNEIKALRHEGELNPNSTNSWKPLGPFGESYPDSPSIKYAGRVKDIEPPRGGVDLRVGAASGGIWDLQSPSVYTPLSSGLPSAWLGSFTTDPANPNIIYAGTGEPDVMGGIGLWRTIDGGVSWQQQSFDSDMPWCFYKIRFDPNISGRIHAATSDGYFRSDDNGNTWTLKFAGLISDFAVNVTNSNIMYIAQKSPGTAGILKSTNGGNSFTRITALPTTDIGKSLIALGNSASTVYVFIGQNSTQLPIGVYKNNNSGIGTWTNITPLSTRAFISADVEYKSVLTVCPADSNTVITATTSMCRTTNGWQTWTEYWDIGSHPYRNLHGDHHRMEWKDNNTVYSSNDGGIAVSSDRGATWNTTINVLPVTQIYNFDAGIDNKNVICGGTQDNGIVKTINLGNSWSFLFTGDGGGIEIDPASYNTIYATHYGSSNPNVSWGRYKSTNGGLGWSEITNNLLADGNWVPLIHSDKTPPIYLYTNAGSYMLRSTDQGSTWTQLNAVAFPTTYILNFSVSIYNAGSVIYACLEDQPESGNHAGKLLRVYDGGTWHERSTGLPTTGAWVRNVTIHPTNIDIAYALMNGFSGQKVFKTTNRGVNWVNITGDLPDIPVSDLAPHPTDDTKLYLSSEFGCYKTTNGGANWITWNNGMPYNLPQSATINSLNVIDSIAQNGRYYILAGTYGRGIWIREISGDDPIGIIPNSTPVSFNLSQNYPNPFNPSTKINYSIAKGSIVKISVYDILGRLVRILVDEKRTRGNYSIEFNASNLSSGVYFYRLYTDGFTDIKKMILVK
jgi:photosystem II stability/assembly factor-like uncharacterized protein